MSARHPTRAGADLAGADLTAYDHSYTDLVGANLSGTTLAMHLLLRSRVSCYPLNGEVEYCPEVDFSPATMRKDRSAGQGTFRASIWPDPT
ncbi:MAG: pentapeptide repeat-containing protein [Acidimicrobiales bacterium]